MLFTVDQAKRSLRVLGLPVNRDHLRKCARAKYLLDNGHLRFIGNDGDWRTYHVASQWTGTAWDGGLYTVRLNGTQHDCTCPDSQKSDICKHRIACKMFEFKQAQEAEQAWIRRMEAYEADRFACDGNELY